MEPDNVSVLVVDDEHIIVDLLTSFLTDNGFEVTGLTDSKEALKYVKENSYDIVLTDLMMPEVTGMDIVQAVKETGHDTQVIIFTGFASIDTAIEAVQHGVYDYIRKPLQLEEIKVILDRAAEKLYLGRENIALHKRVQKMLSDITMLYDITSILYQVDVFDAALDMILDTLTEGMKIKNAALFLFDESLGHFRISKFRGLPNKFVDQFKFNIGDKINNVNVSSSEPTFISDLVTGLSIAGRRLRIGKDLNQCILIPIHYLEQSLGFMGIFSEGSWGEVEEAVFSVEDDVKLLKILATQIAPIFHVAWSGYGDLAQKSQSYDSIMQKLISKGILSAKSMRTAVSFVLLRLTLNKGATADLPPFQDLRLSYESILEKEFGSRAEIMWQNFDSMLIIFQGRNPVTIELSCANVRRKVEDTFGEANGKPVMSMKYAIASYPLDGDSASGIINSLGNKLFSELRLPVGPAPNRESAP